MASPDHNQSMARCSRIRIRREQSVEANVAESSLDEQPLVVVPQQHPVAKRGAVGLPALVPAVGIDQVHREESRLMVDHHPSSDLIGTKNRDHSGLLDRLAIREPLIEDQETLRTKPTAHTP